MKKLSNFTIYFIILITIVCSTVLLILGCSELSHYSTATDELVRQGYLSLVTKYFFKMLGVLVGGFALSTFLYQITRIADNTEKEKHN